MADTTQQIAKQAPFPIAGPVSNVAFSAVGAVVAQVLANDRLLNLAGLVNMGIIFGVIFILAAWHNFTYSWQPGIENPKWQQISHHILEAVFIAIPASAVALGFSTSAEELFFVAPPGSE